MVCGYGSIKTRRIGEKYYIVPWRGRKRKRTDKMAVYSLAEKQSVILTGIKRDLYCTILLLQTFGNLVQANGKMIKVIKIIFKGRELIYMRYSMIFIWKTLLVLMRISFFFFLLTKKIFNFNSIKVFSTVMILYIFFSLFILFFFFIMNFMILSRRDALAWFIKTRMQFVSYPPLKTVITVFNDNTTPLLSFLIFTHCLSQKTEENDIVMAVMGLSINR